MSNSYCEMEDSVEYEYENEESIDNNLKCAICNDPFIASVATPCHHSFCWQCLDKWFKTSGITCPTCRKTISRLDSHSITLLSFLSMLDQILVKCKLCEQSRIQRGNFDDHIEKICPKVMVECLASDIDCLWTGLREELQTHLSTCTFQLSRSRSEASNYENQRPIGKPVQRKTRQFDLIFQVQNINDDLIIMSINPELEHVPEENVMTAIRDVIINKQCTHLNLFKHPLSVENVSSIAPALSHDMSLKSIEFGKCSIGDIGIGLFTKYLPLDSCLEHLDLYDNSITDIGVRYLVDMLKKNPCLFRLKLAYNKITHVGVQLLADVLINQKSKLERLSLVGNTLINDSCIYSICNIIRYNRTLKALHLEECNLSYYAQYLIPISQKIYFRTDLEILL